MTICERLLTKLVEYCSKVTHANLSVLSIVVDASGTVVTSTILESDTVLTEVAVSLDEDEKYMLELQELA